MRNKSAWLFCYAAVVFLATGCAAVIGIGAIAGSGAGYVYVKGSLQSDFKHSYDSTWAACEKTMADMRALNVVPLKEIGQGRINAVINNEKVRFDVQYKGRNVTTVTIRVGLFGNKTASQLLYDRISDNLAKN